MKLFSPLEVNIVIFIHNGSKNVMRAVLVAIIFP